MSSFCKKRFLITQGHHLTNAKLALPDHGAIYARVVFVQANESLHHFRISLDCVWIEVNHDTSLVLQRNANDRSAVPFSKGQGVAHPTIFREGFRAICFNHYVWSKSAQIKLSA